MGEQKTYTYVSFEDQPRAIAPRKTDAWVCKSKTGTVLGGVKWWTHWRRYCFFPANEMLFDANCLWDIADFCATATSDHTKARGK